MKNSLRKTFAFSAFLMVPFAGVLLADQAPTEEPKTPAQIECCGGCTGDASNDTAPTQEPQA